MASEATWKRLENAVRDEISAGYVMRLDVVDQDNKHVSTFLGDSGVILECVR